VRKKKRELKEETGKKEEQVAEGKGHCLFFFFRERDCDGLSEGTLQRKKQRRCKTNDE